MQSSIIKKAHYHNLEFKRLSKIFKKYRKENASTLLEVGFGKGTYMVAARDLGFQVSGVDINPDYVEAARAKGFTCYHISEVASLQEKYDIILMSHLIEHVPHDELSALIEFYSKRLSGNGVLIINTPLLSERFYYDFTHIKPYYPQSIWHAFGNNDGEISIGRKNWRLQLTDIYFVRDAYRTRKLRSYYIKDGTGFAHWINGKWNLFLAILYHLSGGAIGVRMSWIGIYKKVD